MTRPKFYIPKAQNNIKLQLAGAVGAADTSGALTSGGSTLPTIVRGQATSLGDKTTLNDTGGFAGAVVGEGDVIENLTDGSVAVVVSVTSDNSVRTTPLEGGSDNTWQNNDVWAVGCYVGTLTQLDADGLIVKQERVKVTDRTSNTLTWVRQYDGDASQTFNANDYFYIMVEKSVTNEARKAVGNFLMRLEDFYRGTPHYAVATGSSNAFAITTQRDYGSYNDIIGLELQVKANFAVTGAATLNVGGLGAVNIYKNAGLTALEANDIASGQIFTVVYNGTNFQMTSPIGQGSATVANQALFGDASDGNVTISGATTLTRDMYYNNLTVNTGQILSTGGYRIFVKGTLTLTGTAKIKAPTGTAGGAGGNATNDSVRGAAGSAGAGAVGTSLPSSVAGAAGGIGGDKNPANAAAVGANGSAVTNALTATSGSSGGQGGNGGTGLFGGAGETGAVGGTGGSATIGASTRVPFFLQLWATLVGTTWTTIKGFGGAAGGGGGGGGAGGAGGSGVLVYHDKSGWSGSYTLTGGAAGTGGTKGNPTGSNGQGTNGSNGNAGPSGISIELQV